MDTDGVLVLGTHQHGTHLVRVLQVLTVFYYNLVNGPWTIGEKMYWHNSLMVVFIIGIHQVDYQVI